MGKPTRRTALSDRIPGGRDGRRMLIVTFVDRIGSGLWGATATLYFTFAAGLSTAEIGVLLAASGAIGIAGPPLGGLLADRVRLRPLLITVQLVRAAASLALLTTTDLRLLLAIASVGSLGDRGASVLTKLYATRVAGPERVRYQAISRTAMNVGWAVGGLAAAAALTGGTVTVYRWLLIGDALSFVASALFTLACAEPPSASRIAAKSASASASAERGESTPAESAPAPAEPASASAETASASEKTTAPNPWRDRRYLAYTSSEAVLFLDDSVFKVGLPLWAVTATSTPHQLVPLLLVLNNLLVVVFQVPFARFGATPHTARTSLWPLAAAFLLGGAALAASTVGAPWFAAGTLVLAASAFTVAEMLHATISWELSVALAPPTAQGAYLGVHGLAQAVQRSAGPLAVTAAIAAGPLGWLGLGAGLAAMCGAQRHLVRDRGDGALSVAPVTVSEH
ncbi:MFS transporter [Streptomyces iranensis]|uniref:MFS family permease n=1 Tax=Streptomyces iranensis TaxID=576784 RepID=A0A061AA01_9ACTN|nr:MFS transporter [Streptomyces iranensis]MBP2067416.1 MFS family permease [Streptomyces iranensis]CDR15471.1 major facilitator superfamily MFS_1 [Streptomyces iranensis]